MRRGLPPLLALVLAFSGAGCHIFCPEDHESDGGSPPSAPPPDELTGGDAGPPLPPSSDSPLSEGGGTSTGVSIEIPEVPADLEPRLDRVSLVDCELQDDGNWKGYLYVQGANINLGASVYLDGIEVPTTLRETVVNDLLGLDELDETESYALDSSELPWLAYPIYVYSGYAAGFVNVPPGADVVVHLTNSIGKESNSIVYVFPTSVETLDRDGDNLPDEWEEKGYDPDGDGPIPALDLPALGADPLRPDIFLEVDLMESVTRPPLAETYDLVIQGLRDGPVLNPAAGEDELPRENGVALHVDASGKIPHSTYIHFYGTHGYGFDAAPTESDLASLDPADPDPTMFANFYVLKDEHFDADGNRADIYHYGIWAERHSLGNTGYSDAETGYDDESKLTIVGPGNDLIVSLGSALALWNEPRTRPETLMHELGHNLSLRHGGYDEQLYRVGHHSVLSYRWQARADRSDVWRKVRPVAGPLYYGLAEAWEGADGSPPEIDAGWIYVDFSEGMGQEDHPNWTALDYRGPETKGNGEE